MGWSRDAAACGGKGARCGGSRGRCCGKLVCCPSASGVKRCRNLKKDPKNCGACGLRCADGACVHGACACDPFDNRCPMDASEPGERCGCGTVYTGPGGPFQAACVDRNSACDLARPCNSHGDCPPRSVCLVGCKDDPDPTGFGGRRCSTPCVPA